MLDDLPSDDCRYAVLLVDLSVHVGDMLKAFASGAFARPMACVGLCGSSESLEFAKTEVIHFLKSRLLTDSTFMIRGFNIPPATAPSDGITAPTLKLNALAWSGQHIQIQEQDEEKSAIKRVLRMDSMC